MQVMEINTESSYRVHEIIGSDMEALADLYNQVTLFLQTRFECSASSRFSRPNQLSQFAKLENTMDESINSFEKRK